jgi:pantetheine-phosphate adenylyltransferase
MRAIYPGTFDPMTKGHIDIVERGSKIFDELLVSVAVNDRKQTLFTLEERVKMAKESLKQFKNVRIISFGNLLVDFMKQQNVNIILRGLRAVSDFEFELQLALMNRKMYPDCETIFLMPNKKYIFLSSSMIREIAMLGGDVSCFVSDYTNKCIINKFNL